MWLFSSIWVGYWHVETYTIYILCECKIKTLIRVITEVFKFKTQRYFCYQWNVYHKTPLEHYIKKVNMFTLMKPDSLKVYTKLKSREITFCNCNNCILKKWTSIYPVSLIYASLDKDKTYIGKYDWVLQYVLICSAFKIVLYLI